MEEIKLKPCPFCGRVKPFLGRLTEIETVDANHPDYDLLNEQFAVVCDAQNGGCGTTSGFFASKNKACEAWNRRAENE